MLLVGLIVAGISLAVLARRRIHLGVLLSLAVLMAPLAVLALPGRLQERLAGTVVSDQDTLHILWDDAGNLGVPLALVDSIDAIPVDPSARHRMIRWVIAIAAFLQNPILGVGFWASPWAGVGFTHNQYLQVLAEMGLVGFAALVWLMLAIGRSLRARAVQVLGPQAVALRWGLIASAVSLAVQGIAGSPLVLFSFMLAFLFLMGLLVAGGRLARERGASA
jgi:O-antigen ligase